MAIVYAHSDAGSGAMAPSAAVIAAGVEPESMNSGMLVQIVLGVTAIVVILVVVVFQIMNLSVQTVESQLASNAGRAALQEVEVAAAQKLSGYALVDEQAGTYRIPIDRAMELIASETRGKPADGFTDQVKLLSAE